MLLLPIDTQATVRALVRRANASNLPRIGYPDAGAASGRVGLYDRFKASRNTIEQRPQGPRRLPEKPKQVGSRLTPGNSDTLYKQQSNQPFQCRCEFPKAPGKAHRIVGAVATPVRDKQLRHSYAKVPRVTDHHFSRQGFGGSQK